MLGNVSRYLINYFITKTCSCTKFREIFPYTPIHPYHFCIDGFQCAVMRSLNDLDYFIKLPSRRNNRFLHRLLSPRSLSPIQKRICLPQYFTGRIKGQCFHGVFKRQPLNCSDLFLLRSRIRMLCICQKEHHGFHAVHPGRIRDGFPKPFHKLHIKTCFFPNLPLCRLKFCLVLLNMAFAKGHMPFLHLLYKVEPRSILYGIDHRTAAFFVLHCELLPLSHRIVPLHSSSSAQ